MKYIKSLTIALLCVFGTANASEKEDLSACNTADTFRVMGNHKVAEEFYKGCIEKGNLKPKNLAKAQGNLGDVYHVKRDYKNAVDSYTKAAKIYPEDAVVYEIKLANSYKNRGSFEKAIAVYDKILKNYPKHGSVMFSKGLIHEDKNEIDKAKEFYLKAHKNGFENGYLDMKLKKHGLVN